MFHNKKGNSINWRESTQNSFSDHFAIHFNLHEAASTVHAIGNTRTDHDQETTDPVCQYVEEEVDPHIIPTTAHMGELISTIVDEEKIKWEVKTFQTL